MTDWWPLLAAFWGLFFLDGVRYTRRTLWRFATWCGGRTTAAGTHGQWLFASPLPSAWHAVTEDPPFALSPEGICNDPVGSAGKPPPCPPVSHAWRWEEIREVAEKRGRLLINGADFCDVTPYAGARRIKDWAAALTSSPQENRAHLAKAIIADWFRPAHLRRRRRSLLARTRSVMIFNATLLLLLISATLYLVTDGPEWLGEKWSGRLVDSLPLFGGYCVLLHLAALVAAWLAHRKLHPRRGEERFTLLLSASLLPPQALRWREHLSRDYFTGAHPLALAAAVASPDGFKSAARAVFQDLRWPLPLTGAGSDGLTARIHEWMRPCVTRVCEKLVRSRDVSIDALLAPPSPDSAGSVAYCPRCRAQFIRGITHCPEGIRLLALETKPSA